MIPNTDTEWEKVSYHQRSCTHSIIDPFKLVAACCSQNLYTIIVVSLRREHFFQNISEQEYWSELNPQLSIKHFLSLCLILKIIFEIITGPDDRPELVIRDNLSIMTHLVLEWADLLWGECKLLLVLVVFFLQWADLLWRQCKLVLAFIVFFLQWADLMWGERELLLVTNVYLLQGGEFFLKLLFLHFALSQLLRGLGWLHLNVLYLSHNLRFLCLQCCHGDAELPQLLGDLQVLLRQFLDLLSVTNIVVRDLAISLP